MTGMLASVRDLREARAVLRAHRAHVAVAVLDLKDPATGALGALPLATIRDVVAEVAGVVPVSATTGDMSLDDARLETRIRATHAAGVAYVKVGVFDDGILRAGGKLVLARCAAAGARLVPVFFAERLSALPDCDELARLGVAGVMLDTEDKAAGGLRAVLDMPTLAGFVRRARAAGLLCGLAGSLRAADVPPLLALSPDYLGFRGALCGRAGRAGRLDEAALRRVGRLFPRRAASDSPFLRYNQGDENTHSEADYVA